MKAIKLLAIALLFTTLACEDKEEPPHPQPATLAEEIENIFQPMVDNKTTVGVSVGIVKPGGEKEMFFFGEKNKDEGNKPDPNTLYEIGSITKTMTATVLADMAMNGDIDLDEAVENYLPEIENFPDYNGEKSHSNILQTTPLPYQGFHLIYSKRISMKTNPT